jgi:hypothetical protein
MVMIPRQFEMDVAEQFLRCRLGHGVARHLSLLTAELSLVANPDFNLRP